MLNDPALGLPGGFGDPVVNGVVGVMLGAVIGSFIGLVADRWPRGESIVAAPSRCQSCGVQIRAWQLVPILSYVLLRARCGQCRARLPIDLVLAELGGAIVAVIALHVAHDATRALTLGVFGWSLLLLALLDARHFWLPDAITLPLCLAGLACMLVLPGPPVPEAVVFDRMAGAVLGFASLALVRLTYRALRGREGLGGGDPKLLAAIGAWLGATALPGIVLGATLLALGWVLVMRLRGNAVDAATAIPLGTPLAIAAVAAIPFTAAWLG